MGIRAYLKTGAVPPKNRDGVGRTLKLLDEKTFPVSDDEEGFYINLESHHIGISPALVKEILDMADFFTVNHNGYAARPTARELPETGIYQYKAAKADLAAVNGGGYKLFLRFECYEDGLHLFMVLWHWGLEGHEEGITFLSDPNKIIYSTAS